jgi:hypothetical protein
VPPEAALDALRKTGMAEWNARAVSELYGVFATGSGARITDVVERITHNKPIDFEEFAREHSGAFN